MSHPLTDPGRRLVIGHRGDRAHAPENTIESLTLAVEAGVDALEFDVRATGDGVAVLMHDATLERTVHDARGLLSLFSLAEVSSLDASRGNAGWTGGRTAVPTLEEVLDRFRGVPIVIDVKEAAVTAPTVALVHKLGLQGSIVVGSDNAIVMGHLYRSGLRACASPTDAIKVLVMSLVGLAPRNPPYSVLSLPTHRAGWELPIARMVASARRCLSQCFRLGSSARLCSSSFSCTLSY